MKRREYEKDLYKRKGAFVLLILLYYFHIKDMNLISILL